MRSRWVRKYERQSSTSGQSRGCADRAVSRAWKWPSPSSVQRCSAHRVRREDAWGKRTLARSGELLAGVEAIDDPDGVGELLLGEAPDPGGTIAEDDLAVGPGEAPAVGFASDATVEVRRLRVGVASGRALDGRRVGE